jgi:uncharacterized damage-inducible protein DinB
MLTTWLDYHRQTLLQKCAGLTAAQLALRPVEPSNLSLLGLVRHLADVERGWVRVRVAGEPIDFRFCGDDNPEGDLDDIDPADAEAVFAAFAEETALVDAAAARRSLDETFFHERQQLDISLRWVYIHLIEEYARHNGHADLIRERIDGATGE